MSFTCPACNSAQTRLFFEIAKAPVLCNVLLSSRRQALAVPRAHIQLAFCRDCGLIYNRAFDDRLITYSGEYENALDFSPHFQQYATKQASRLIREYKLHKRNIIGIGCGQGAFLSLLCTLGHNRGIGFDPSFDPHKPGTIIPSCVRIIPELYSSQYAACDADFITCRHVLEHISRPLDLLLSIRQTIGDRSSTVLFFEVPNALFTLRSGGIWDIIYEHCSYFTPPSLARLFRAAGFDPIRINQPYSGQFITIEARPQTSRAPRRRKLPALSSLAPLVRKFPDQYDSALHHWRHTLGKLSRAQQRTIIWGAGSKGINFLNTMDRAAHCIKYAVDLNLRKHGRYIAGTGQRIVPPEFLRRYRPAVIILMNPIYRREVAQLLKSAHIDTRLLLA